MRPNQSNMASVAVLSQQLQKDRGMNFKTVALGTAALAATFLGGLGLGASMMIDRAKNSEVAKDQKKTLAKHYREQIAAQLGMSPDQVNYSDLEKAAQVNPQFAQLVNKINVEQGRADRSALAATTVGLAAGGWMPGISAASNIVGKAAAPVVMHVGGALTGGLAAGLAQKDTLYTQDIVEHINAKQAQGMPVDGYDIVLLRISQDPSLQQAIHKQSGKAFHKMNEAEQRTVTASLPQLYETADADAAALNSGRITEQDLLVSSPGANQFTPPAPASSWSQRVGGKRAAQGSFVQSYQAEQAGPANIVR